MILDIARRDSADETTTLGLPPTTLADRHVCISLVPIECNPMSKAPNPESRGGVGATPCTMYFRQ